MENKKKYINLDIKSFGMIAALVIIFIIFFFDYINIIHCHLSF